MKNIFSIPDIKIGHHSTPAEKKKAMDNLEHFLQNYIPLRSPDDNHHINEHLHQSLIELLSSHQTIDSIAELTLELCTSYLHHEIADYQVKNLDIDTLLSINSNEIMKVFDNRIITQSNYREELKDFLILSYYYNQNSCNLTLSQVSKVLDKKKEFSLNDKADKAGETDKVDKADKTNKTNATNAFDPIKTIYQKLSDIYRVQRKSKESFLLPFVNYKINKDKNIGIDICNLYDVEILLSLINSSTPAKNIFIKLMDSSEYNFKINSFLTLFKDLSLNENSRIDILDILKSEIESQNFISKKRVYIYNQFLLERITNLNLINLLSDLSNLNEFMKPYLYKLYELSSLPLLNLRLKILSYIIDIPRTAFEDCPMLIDDLLSYLKEFLQHHLVCTLPILSLVFEHLLQLSSWKESSNESIGNNFFDKLIKDQSFNFFEINSDHVPFPDKYKMPEFNIDSKKNKMEREKEYHILIRKVTQEFIKKTCHVENNENIFCKVDNLRTKQETWLNEAFYVNSFDLSTIKRETLSSKVNMKIYEFDYSKDNDNPLT